MATPKGDHNPTQYESPWLFCDGVFLCAILITKHVTQHSTHNGFSHTCSLMACCGSSVCGDGAKRCEQEKQRGGWGREWEHRISISLSHPPLSLNFFPRFVTLHRTSSTAQNRLALLPQATSSWVTILASFDSYIWTFLSYTGSVFSRETNHIKGWMQMGFCTLALNSWPQLAHRYVTRYSANCQVQRLRGTLL